MKKVLLLLAVLLTPMFADAQQVSEQEALQKAQQFFANRNKSQAARGMSPRKAPKLTLANNRDEFFIFNDEANGGYVIVSGDERTPDVLGYSDDGHYNSGGVPCNMQAVLDGYAEQVSYLRAHPEYKIPTPKRAEETKVSPLLGETAWGQGWPYNNMCPMIDGQHCPTGCVATAAAQVMYYHKWPERGQGSHSYEWNGQTLSADFSQSVYRWDLMTPTYDSNSSQESCDAVALLMKDVGYALNICYSIGESGGGPEWGLIYNFDYDESMTYISRAFCDADTWHHFILDDLLNGLPVIYGGGSAIGGHTFVIDGYDGDGYFHFNFGWGGDSNGNYTMLSVPFNSSPGITFGIKKNEGGKPRHFFGAHDDFIYVPETDALESKDMEYMGAYPGRIPVYNALAVEDINSHKILYVDQVTISSWSEWWNVQYHLTEKLSDGDYILYPVARMREDLPWQKFIFLNGRQSFVELNVTNGIKTYANNHISDDIQDGAVEIDNIYYFLVDSKHEATVTFKNDRYASYSGDVTIPTSIEYNGQKYDVTEIGNSAFLGSTLGVLKVAKTIRSIKSGAFNTVKVDRILFEKDSELKEIEGFAFQVCDINSGQLDLPEGLEFVTYNAFFGAFIPWISIPKSISDLYFDVFSSTIVRNLSVHWDTPPILTWGNPFSGYDLSLCTLYVPKGTVEKYSQADIWKDFGRIIEMGDTITIDGIKYMLFDKDNSATLMSAFDMNKETFSIPSIVTYQGKNYSVNRISPFAFANSSVREVTIPSSVEYIGEGAFQGRYYSYLNCLKLCHKNPPMVADMTDQGKEGFNSFRFRSYLSGNFKDIALYVPSGSKSKYQSDSFWGQFKNIIEDESLNVKEYKLTYLVDGEAYKTLRYVNGDKIVPEAAPTKEGYTFNGWSEIPATMPAKDVTVTGTFTVNKYMLTYTVDGKEYKASEVEFGTALAAEAAPKKDGYTFSGWSEIPETMPAKDVTVSGSFAINSYKLTYMVDDKVYKEATYEYGATITPESQPEGDYLSFEWGDLPKTMPANDVVVYASYTSGIVEALMAAQRNVRIYSPNGKKRDKLQRGLNIVVFDDGTVHKVVK